MTQRTIPITQVDKTAGAALRANGYGHESGIKKNTASVDFDSTCADTDMWAFDETNFGGNELCIYADGLPARGDLSTFIRTVTCSGTCFYTYWNAAVQSWYSGDQLGSWEEYEHYEFGWVSFYSYWDDGDFPCRGAQETTTYANFVNFYNYAPGETDCNVD